MRLSVSCTPGMSDFFDEVSRPGNAFSRDGKPYVKSNLICGALASWALGMLKGEVNKRQLETYKTQRNNEYIFILAVAYCRAKRGEKGYRIDRQKIVHGPELKLGAEQKLNTRLGVLK